MRCVFVSISTFGYGSRISFNFSFSFVGFFSFFFFFVLSLQQWESGISIQIGCVKTQLFGFKWLSIIHGQNMESHLNSQDYKGHIVLP